MKKSKGSFPCAKKKSLDEFLEDALRDAPVIKGYSIKDLAEICNIPWSTARLRLEGMEARGFIEHIDIGRAKLYSLKKK